jgi:AcrR family transcriptional regulator
MSALLTKLCDAGRMTESTASSVRAIARAEMTDRIKQVARRHLAADGPNLSLRAVARDLGVVSSAVYRYFASRDELLTALIIEAYDSMGDTVDEAEAAVARGDLAGRWLAVGRAVRAWALAHPHEYALLYGSPVPGYAAPQDTIGPASRPVVVIIAILRAAGERGGALVRGGPRLPPAVRVSFERIQAHPQFGGVAPPLFARGMTAWAQLFGALSFELFGRLTNTVDDYEAFFDYQLRAMADYLGL